MIIYHDYGSRGNAGLYSKKIIEELVCRNEIVVSLMHHEYPFKQKSVIRCFGFFERIGIGKNVFKFFEIFALLLVVYFLTFFVFLFERKRPIIILNIYQPFLHYYLFLFFSPHLNKKIIIHDGIPHKNFHANFFQVQHFRFPMVVDHVIAIGNETESIYKRYFNNVVSIPFPLFDTFNQKNNSPKTNKFSILFIGHIREEKGLDDLLVAWRQCDNKNMELKIYGTYNNDLGYDFENLPNSAVRFGYLSDVEFETLLSSSHFVITPYRTITNSGILFNAIAFRKPIIYRDIPLFRNLGLLGNELRFNTINELVFILNKINSLSIGEYENFLKMERLHLEKYEQNFKKKFSEMMCEIKK